MSSSNRRPPTLLEYLIEHDFVPQSEGTWFDHHTGDGIIRVVHQPGEEAQLISLTPAIGCRFKAMFYAGTPDVVIIAAVEAALTLAQPEPAAPGGPAGPTGHVRRGRPDARRHRRGERR